MVRFITQQTFNDVVKENIKEFCMNPNEAVEEAIQQFEAQGVDLSNIIKNAEIIEGTDPLSTSLHELKSALKEDNKKQFHKNVKILQKECNKDMASKIMAGKEGAFTILTDGYDKYMEDKEVTVSILKTMLTLTTGYPDLLDMKGASILTSVVIKNKDLDQTRLGLKIFRECCLKHEKNRQIIILNLSSNKIVHLIDSPVTKEVLMLVRALCLDDDIRETISHAHEHARMLAIDLLCPLTTLLGKYVSNPEVLSDILLTITMLIVRNEFCAKFEEAGGLNLISSILIDNCEKEKVCRMCLSLLKTLAGNDDVKAKIMAKEDLVQIIAFCFDRHKGHASFCSTGLGLVSALALRSPENSKNLVQKEFPELIIDAMKQHPSDASVQRQGCWAIRNTVARSRHFCGQFLKLGAEEVLIAVMLRYKDCLDDSKAALRDLGCSVKLVEQWTGQGVAMKND